MRNIKSYLLGLILCFLSISVAAKDTVLACGHHDYPPWSWIENGVVKGACADLVREIFNDLKINLSLRYDAPWARCQRDLESGAIDLKICSFKTDKRSKYSVFTNSPVGFMEYAVFVNKDKRFTFNDWGDLKGRMVATSVGTSSDQEFDQFLEEHTTIYRVVNHLQAFKMLSRQRVEFVPLHRFSGRLLIRELNLGNSIQELTKPVHTGDLFISMSKHSKHLALIMNINDFLQRENQKSKMKAMLEASFKQYVELLDAKDAKNAEDSKQPEKAERSHD